MGRRETLLPGAQWRIRYHMNTERQIQDVLAAFRRRVGTEVYAEGDSPLHTDLTAVLLPAFVERFRIQAGTKVLDVGCGAGVALAHFERLGMRATGITLSEEDRDACLARGFSCELMDQSFLDFDDRAFGFVWCRHAIEHSPWPYLTLLEINRVVEDRGLVYIEVPRPDDPRRHEENSNHYSVLGPTMWESLFSRAGFHVAHRDTIVVPMVNDEKGAQWSETYLIWVLKKVVHESLREASLAPDVPAES